MIGGWSWYQLLVRAIAVVLAMGVHESAHGLVSYWFGDPTAKRAGRLSLNPFRHVDWAGLLCLLFFGFGWAKPVPINPRFYRNEKTGIIWTSFAGPASNFILSFVCLLVSALLMRFLPGTPVFIQNVLQTTAMMSLGFGVFNLLPVPPLDGAKIFWAFLPDKEYYRLNEGAPWIGLVFIFILWTGVLSGPLNMVIRTIANWMLSAVSAIVF